MKMPSTRPKKQPAKGSKKPTEKVENVSSESIRLNRFIANAGICSRRDADLLIAAGKITLNGKVVTELGTKVLRSDHVVYEGKSLQAEKLSYVLLNKPKDFITTMEDTHGRKTVMDLVKSAGHERIVPVGRLDKNTTGLLLFTNDGELTKKLTHPSHKVRKLYHVKAHRDVSDEDLEKLLQGFELEDGFVKADEVSRVVNLGDSEIGILLHSGKNRIVRRMMEHLDYRVIKLDRVLFANLTKKDLPRGKWRKLDEKEITLLKRIGGQK